MTTIERQKRNKRIVKYLSTPIGTTIDGKPIYPSYAEAANLFGLAATHIFLIKKQLIGLDKDGIREYKEDQE